MSGLTPQVWYFPALTDSNSPSGGEAWPPSSRPQQATGVQVFKPLVGTSADDWSWGLGVNLHGVIHAAASRASSRTP